MNLDFFAKTNVVSKMAMIEEYRLKVFKEMQIYEELNKCRLDNKILVVEFWVPSQLAFAF